MYAFWHRSRWSHVVGSVRHVLVCCCLAPLELTWSVKREVSAVGAFCWSWLLRCVLLLLLSFHHPIMCLHWLTHLLLEQASGALEPLFISLSLRQHVLSLQTLQWYWFKQGFALRFELRDLPLLQQQALVSCTHSGELLVHSVITVPFWILSFLALILWGASSRNLVKNHANQCLLILVDRVLESVVRIVSGVWANDARIVLLRAQCAGNCAVYGERCAFWTQLEMLGFWRGQSAAAGGLVTNKMRSGKLLSLDIDVCFGYRFCPRSHLLLIFGLQSTNEASWFLRYLDISLHSSCRRHRPLLFHLPWAPSAILVLGNLEEPHGPIDWLHALYSLHPSKPRLYLVHITHAISRAHNGMLHACILVLWMSHQLVSCHWFICHLLIEIVLNLHHIIKR